MKSTEHRDAVVERVQAAAAKYPTLESLPVGGKPSSNKSKVISIGVEDRGPGNGGYVAALYELSYEGAVAFARTSDGEVVGEIVGESAAGQISGKKISAG